MTITKLGILGITNNENKLVAIVYHDESKRSQIFYTVDECGMEEIAELLQSINEEKNDSK